MENILDGNTNFAAGASGNSERSLHTASSTAHGAVNAVAGAAEEAARKAKPAIDRMAKMAHQAVDSAASAAAPTASWLGEQGQSLMATRKQLVDDTCKYVAANPLKSVGIAVVAGFVLSRIILR